MLLRMSFSSSGQNEIDLLEDVDCMARRLLVLDEVELHWDNFDLLAETFMGLGAELTSDEVVLVCQKVVSEGCPAHLECGFGADFGRLVLLSHPHEDQSGCRLADRLDLSLRQSELEVTVVASPAFGMDHADRSHEGQEGLSAGKLYAYPVGSLEVGAVAEMVFGLDLSYVAGPGAHWDEQSLPY